MRGAWEAWSGEETKCMKQAYSICIARRVRCMQEGCKIQSCPKDGGPTLKMAVGLFQRLGQKTQKARSLIDQQVSLAGGAAARCPRWSVAVNGCQVHADSIRCALVVVYPEGGSRIYAWHGCMCTIAAQGVLPWFRKDAKWAWSVAGVCLAG